jgi:ABC-type lipopolysaccharide export system ATPase subunit
LSPVMIEKAICLIKEVKQHKGILITDHLYRHVMASADHLYCVNTGAVLPIQGEEQLIRFGYLSDNGEPNSFGE